MSNYLKEGLDTLHQNKSDFERYHLFYDGVTIQLDLPYGFGIHLGESHYEQTITLNFPWVGNSSTLSQNLLTFFKVNPICEKHMDTSEYVVYEPFNRWLEASFSPALWNYAKLGERDHNPLICSEWHCFKEFYVGGQGSKVVPNVKIYANREYKAYRDDKILVVDCLHSTEPLHLDTYLNDLNGVKFINFGFDKPRVADCDQPYFILDLDGTMFDLSKRLYLIEQDPADWDGFYKAINVDTPITPNIAIANVMKEASNRFSYIFTGRSERTFHETMVMMKKANVPCDYMVMRLDGVYDPDTEIKEHGVKFLGLDPEKCLAVLEDRNSVVKMWRSLGFPCLQVADGDY